ncbi:MAG TPA: proteasome activator [Acidimicrobiales bacterium]|nr:proteasome activator [Acidimicrobiales bacterium]
MTDNPGTPEDPSTSEVPFTPEVSTPSDTDEPGPRALVPTDIAEPGPPEEAEMVSQPAKLMRIASMAKQLLEEVRAAPLDNASRKRMKEIYRESVRQLEDTLSPELADELDRLAIPFDTEPPTDAELRVAQGQLVGWLAGLFQGIQATLFLQQAATQRQLEQMRGAGSPRDPRAVDVNVERTPYL